MWRGSVIFSAFDSGSRIKWILPGCLCYVLWQETLLSQAFSTRAINGYMYWRIGKVYCNLTKSLG